MSPDAAGGVQLLLQYSFFRARAKFSLSVTLHGEQPEQPLACHFVPWEGATGAGSSAMAPATELQQQVDEICGRYSTGFGRLQAIHEDIEAFMNPVA